MLGLKSFCCFEMVEIRISTLLRCFWEVRDTCLFVWFADANAYIITFANHKTPVGKTLSSARIHYFLETC